MATKIFILSILGTVASAAYCWTRLTAESYTGLVQENSFNHPCPTLGLALEEKKPLPAYLTTCSCGEPVGEDGRWAAVHPPQTVAETAAKGDSITIFFGEFTPPFSDETLRSVSYEISRGTNKEGYAEAGGGSIWGSFIAWSLGPLVIGAVLAGLAFVIGTVRKGPSD